MQLKNKKILITGADGFIGSHLAELILPHCAHVRALVQYNSQNHWGWLEHSPKAVRESLEIIAGDVRDPHGMRQISDGCDIIFHLAALIAIPFSYQAPAAYVDTNITGTLNLLQAAREKGIERFIHTSTSEIYGSAQFVPMTEEHPVNAQSPYAATKVAADQLALSFYRSFELPVTVLRPFNTYGPRQSARAVIPTLITQIASGKQQIQLGALHPTRDFNFVTDTAQAFIAVARSDKCAGEVLNAGTGFEFSIGETATMIAELMGTEIAIQTDTTRLRPPKSEVTRLLAATDKIMKLTEWQPDFTGTEGFRKGLSNCIEWYSNPANLSLFKTGIYNL